MQSGVATKIFLLEEPENHLSHSNLNSLISSISNKAAGKQLILTTHSSFVLNKLGIENVMLFTRNGCMTLQDLTDDTRDYFLKLPGHDTLRMILSKRVILVEGPSDELVVMKAYKKVHGVLPLEHGVDIVSVKSLAFKRFLEISKLLKIAVAVVTDNDGSIDTLKSKYLGFLDIAHIQICFSSDETLKTLEPQICAKNSLANLNLALNKKFNSVDEVCEYMSINKTDSALAIFNSKIDLNWPDYILKAIG
ncbi:MAG: hypothetical protein EOP06_01895 [Proteobacteria bacterium]|nr:MAG: hypothetical protein EOP06_01895 [Pseudomonadota bacterium]